MNKRQAPTIEKNPSTHVDERETHPAFAMIGASRVSCTGEALHGSDFLHHNYISVRVYESELNRTLSRDWHHATRTLVEVSLSEAQWATFISTLNMGDGVPCTLGYAADRGYVPGIARPKRRTEQFTDEVRQTLADAEQHLRRLEALIAASKLSAKAKEEMESELTQARNNLAANVDFVGKSFAEHVERTTEHAKVEVEAYLTNAVQRAGITALGGQSPAPIELPEGGTDD